MKHLHLKQEQKIGQSGGKPRICLWNRKLIECGFGIGQTFLIKQITALMGVCVQLTPSVDGKRKVSRVVNHGNELPVIDLKHTKSLDIAALGDTGDKVSVEFLTNKIIIRRINQ